MLFVGNRGQSKAGEEKTLDVAVPLFNVENFWGKRKKA